MAYDLLRSAKHIRGLTNAEFRVLFYLLEAANSETHECYPSMKRIGSFTDMAERTVQRHISSLADRGLFERVEQRRSDGSRSVNCYRFVAIGTIKIGKESIIQLGREAETEAELPPAENDGLFNTPIETRPAATLDAPSRQSGRDIDQESEPGIGTNLPSANAEADLSLGDQIFTRWKAICEQNPGIAMIRKLDSGILHTIEQRGRQHARPGEKPIDVWNELLDNIATSRFLQGRVPPGPGRDTPFKLTIAWATNATHFREIIGGKYNGDRTGAGFDPNTGRRLGPTAQAALGTLERIRARHERGERGGNTSSDYR